MTGYLHSGYAESLAEFGQPRLLPKSRGWILKRQIPGYPLYDAMGCYPLFACQDWSQLHTDINSMAGELISLALVTDPFGAYDAAYLQRCFKDVVIPFKEHFIIDLGRKLDTFVSSHHSRYARKALQNVFVQRCHDPAQFLGEWVDLYAFLIARHRIDGIPSFSRSSFERQLNVPGITMFRAVHKDVTVGMTLWYTKGEVSYYHLGAYSDLGYQLRASFALFWSTIEYFSASGLRWLSLGAGAGVNGKNPDGLSRFKQGWSTGSRPAYFCGRIFHRERYLHLAKATAVTATDYFPAYRRGDFH